MGSRRNQSRLDPIQGHRCLSQRLSSSSVGERSPGHLYIALFGDEHPMTAPAEPRAGRCIARIDPATWTMEQILTDPLIRPIDVGFRPGDGALHMVDFG